MSTIRFRKFTKPQFLKQVGRQWLTPLFARFREDLAARGAALPAEDLEDDAYFDALAARVMAPDALPEALIEALFAIEELANAEGQERLEMAVIEAGLPLEFAAEATHGDIAVQVYLAQPALVAATQTKARLGRLSAFEYFGGNGGGPVLAAPSSETLAGMTAELDAWFKAHQRGRETTQIEVHEVEGELWFLLRHGDTFTRTAKVEARRLHILHFRPAKDDVVAYAPKWDELRIHAGTTGEKELYRRAFGRWLFGDAEYFCHRKACTLEPLREDCASVLSVRGLPGVSRIVLREVELAWGRQWEERMVRKGCDLLGSARARGREAIPEYGTVVRAVFDFHFIAQERARRVEVRLPNTVKLGRHCDGRVVHEWLAAGGLRVNASEVRNAATGVVELVKRDA